MRPANILGILALVAALAAPAPARAEAPLSAIDWLSDSVRKPPEPEMEDGGDVAITALPDSVSVATIGTTQADALGLLPVGATGLPGELWANSTAGAIADRLRAERSDLLPAMQELLYLLLLVEAAPPTDAGPEPELLLARIDTLLALGALDQAAALLAQSGASTPELFRRAFDVSLLLGTEDRTCAQLRDTPALSPTFPARVFCLARGGDWEGAALSLDTGKALGFVTPEEDALLAHFLELGLDDTDLPLPIPSRPSPLEFRMYEAIGRPLPTSSLPRAFAHTDLNRLSGWKAQIEAAERLAQTGAVGGETLFALYTERRPAASGGVWDRAAAIQALDAALLTRDRAVLSTALAGAWQAMRNVELEVPFARAFCRRVAGRRLSVEAAEIAVRMCLLGGDAGRAPALPHDPPTDLAFLGALAAGEIPARSPGDPMLAAIRLGMAQDGVPVRLQSLMAENRHGEAILRAIDMFGTGATGDLDELTDALAFFRAIGLAEVATNGAIQLVLLDRRG